MIVIRDKAIKTLTKCEPFINVITDDTAIAFEKHKEDYPKSSDQIQNGLTKQDGQYYYFEHDIINTPRSFSSKYHFFNFILSILVEYYIIMYILYQIIVYIATIF